MTSNRLKVTRETSSHCTTPSEQENLLTVKVGCFHINPSSKRGRRTFLLQMLIVCFVPHVALVVQNCSIMAQLSQTFEASLYLDTEVNTLLSLQELVISIQDERQVITQYLLSSSADTFKLKAAFKITDKLLNTLPYQETQGNIMTMKNMNNIEALKRMTVYEDLNAVFLLYVARLVKQTTSPLWRHLSASFELLKAREDLSLCVLLLTTSSTNRKLDFLIISSVKIHSESGKNRLNVTAQYLEAEDIVDQNKMLDEVSLYFDQVEYITNMSIKKQKTNFTQFFVECPKYLEQMKILQYNLWRFVGECARQVVWLARRTLAIGIAILVLVFLAAPVMLLLLRHIAYTIQTFTNSLEQSTQKLEAEKQKSDLLLCRMLPMPVLRSLRAQRTVPAEAFDAVTIFFSDIVGFTTIAATSTPMEVINMLNMLYRLFDEKITHYDVYKVETIGDAYMVVSGLPQRNGNNHASEIADMSLSLMRSLEGACVPHRADAPLVIRAGVNTGPCVAGVVGATMPRYCLFGDTINTASRMESTGEAMKIHISDTTKKALDEFGNYEFQSRGAQNIAGKGCMETFWLLGKQGGIRSESPRGRHFEDYNESIMELLIRS